jgi:hypothetical protein
MATAFIYYRQLRIMKEQKRISEKSFCNQETILKEQKDIAEKQYNFNIFEMRMNLRNELQKEFTFLLDNDNKIITADVNPIMANIGKIIGSIKMAFPKNQKLNEIIVKFKKHCGNIHTLAIDRRVMIECAFMKRNSGKGLKYKECIQAWVENNNQTLTIVNQAKFDELGISRKEYNIIGDIMHNHINDGDDIYTIQSYMQKLFNTEMQTGQKLLNQMYEILDKDITLLG